MFEQIQESVDLIQEVKVVEQLHVKVDVDQFQERVEVLREQLETALHNWREQFTPGVAGPQPVKVEVEAESADAQEDGRKEDHGQEDDTQDDGKEDGKEDGAQVNGKEDGAQVNAEEDGPEEGLH